jgi:hypothetical protein
MSNFRVIELVFVFSGFIPITIAALSYMNLWKDMKIVKEHMDKATVFILRAYIVLIVFFLTCYSFL